MGDGLDFVGIGAQKCGTTWFYRMLKQHPEISFGYTKELNFFNTRKFFLSKDTGNYGKGIEWYRDKLEIKPGKLNGEISVDYMLDERCARRIYEHFPDAKIFAVLRDPVERAYSQYHFSNRLYNIGDDFLDGLEKYPEYVERGRYYEKLSDYYEVFDEGQIHIILFSDFKDDAAGVLAGLEEFLGVEPYIPDDVDERVNKTPMPRFDWVRTLFLWSLQLKDTRLGEWLWSQNFFHRLKDPVIDLVKKHNLEESERPCLDPETKKKVYPRFSDDIDVLENLIKRDLEAWRPKEVVS